MAKRTTAAAIDPKRPLAGKVAVVAGATRGAGRGIARGLGEAGAFVICTGRSVRGQPSPYNRPETVDETAEMITAAGGQAIAVRVDHTVEDEVQALFERVSRDHKRLDVLVNSIAGEDPLLGGWTTFWKTDLTHADLALRQALLSHVITAKYAAPLLIEQRRGLIVEVTEFDLLFSGGNVLGQLVKFSLKGLAMIMAEELRKHRIAAIAITPGFLRSESMLQHFGVTEETWRNGGEKDPNFLESETPLFLGRAVAALAADPKVMEMTGSLTSSWEMSRKYGFSDADGRRPDWGRHWVKILPSMGFMKKGHERHRAWLEQLSTRVNEYLDAASVSR